MGNIKNEVGKEGPKATAIKGNKNGLVLSESLGSLSVVLISATPFQNVILLLTYYFGCMSVVSEGSAAVVLVWRSRAQCGNWSSCQVGQLQ